MTRARIRRFQGAALHAGDSYVDVITGPHTIASFDVYPGRFTGDTVDECCRMARCTDGSCERVRDHGWYRRTAHPTIDLPLAA